jgi:hypothetical protein
MFGMVYSRKVKEHQKIKVRYVYPSYKEALMRTKQAG